MPVYKDQLGRSVEMNHKPERIISLVPSQTELLYHLGLDEEVAGITKFCIHPRKWFLTKPRVGGTKQLNIEKIRELNPDLIIANKEENVREQIELLEAEYPVWISDVNNLDDALEMISQIGLICQSEKTDEIVQEIKKGFNKLQKLKLTNFTEGPGKLKTMQTAYLIWRDPYMSVGGDTFIHDMMDRCGFKNIFSGRMRYPVVTLQDLQQLEGGLLLLSSEPYPFKEKHVLELQTLLPSTTILLVDGTFFSWYGSRLIQAPSYFEQLQVLSLRHAAAG